MKIDVKKSRKQDINDIPSEPFIPDPQNMMTKMEYAKRMDLLQTYDKNWCVPV